LLIQKRRRAGDYVVALYDSGNGTPIATSQGPLDVMPSFGAGDRVWFFVRYDRHAIVRCERGEPCHEVHVDPQVPAWPVVAPDGINLAYLTWLNTPRVKVLSLRTGQARDLGAALLDCAPVWSDGDHVWIVQASARSREWIEIDVRTGQRAGRRRPAGDGTLESHGCSFDESLLPARYPQIAVVGRELSEIRAIHAPEPR
jgi:hypothetical protein